MNKELNEIPVLEKKQPVLDEKIKPENQYSPEYYPANYYQKILEKAREMFKNSPQFLTALESALNFELPTRILEERKKEKQIIIEADITQKTPKEALRVLINAKNFLDHCREELEKKMKEEKEEERKTEEERIAELKKKLGRQENPDIGDAETAKAIDIINKSDLRDLVKFKNYINNIAKEINYNLDKLVDLSEVELEKFLEEDGGIKKKN